MIKAGEECPYCWGWKIKADGDKLFCDNCGAEWLKLTDKEKQILKEVLDELW